MVLSIEILTFSVIGSVVRSTVCQWSIVSSGARDIEICRQSCASLACFSSVVKCDLSEYQRFLSYQLWSVLIIRSKGYII